MINTTLKSINRTPIESDPMTTEELSVIGRRQERLDENLYRTIQSELKKGRLTGSDAENRLNKLRDSKRQTSFELEADLVTGAFTRRVQKAARRIHTELAKAGRRGIDVEVPSRES